MALPIILWPPNNTIGSPGPNIPNETVSPFAGNTTAGRVAREIPIRQDGLVYVDQASVEQNVLTVLEGDALSSIPANLRPFVILAAIGLVVYYARKG